MAEQVLAMWFIRHIIHYIITVFWYALRLNSILAKLLAALFAMLSTAAASAAISYKLCKIENKHGKMGKLPVSGLFRLLFSAASDSSKKLFLHQNNLKVSFVVSPF